MRSLVIGVSLLSLAAADSAMAQRDTVFSWSKALPAGAHFAIRNLNGGIDVRPGTTDRIEVRATILVDSRGWRDVTFDVREKSADDITICTIDRGVTPCDPDDTISGDDHPSVRYTVELPKDLHLSFLTRNGSVIVMQSAASVVATTRNGDVVVRESLAGVTATTSGSGDVTVAAANGPVRASSGNGSVLVATYGGPVNASSGNGDVDVRMITVAPPSDQLAMTLSSGNGDVRLTLPADFSGEVDASTGHGKLKSDFPIHDRAGRDDSRVRGKIGNGAGLLIRMHSGNGRLEIRKG